MEKGATPAKVISPDLRTRLQRLKAKGSRKQERLRRGKAGGDAIACLSKRRPESYRGGNEGREIKDPGIA